MSYEATINPALHIWVTKGCRVSDCVYAAVAHKRTLPTFPIEEYTALSPCGGFHPDLIIIIIITASIGCCWGVKQCWNLKPNLSTTYNVTVVLLDSNGRFYGALLIADSCVPQRATACGALWSPTLPLRLCALVSLTAPITSYCDGVRYCVRKRHCLFYPYQWWDRQQWLLSKICLELIGILLREYVSFRNSTCTRSKLFSHNSQCWLVFGSIRRIAKWYSQMRERQ